MCFTDNDFQQKMLRWQFWCWLCYWHNSEHFEIIWDFSPPQAIACEQDKSLTITPPPLTWLRTREHTKNLMCGSVILLPLSPVSLTHKNAQRHKIIIIHDICPMGCKDQLIDANIYIYRNIWPVHVISVAVIMAVLYNVTMHISFYRLCCAWK